MITQSKKLTRARKRCDKAIQIKGKELFPKSLVSGLPTEVLHHFFPKSTSAVLRYDWNNLIPLTHGEHLRHHQAGDPSIHATVIRKKGMDWYNKLEKKRREIIKINLGYYDEQYTAILNSQPKKNDNA